MGEAYELEHYLPLSFKTKSEEEYIAFLWEAFDANCRAEKFQFAFLAYHMLTMAAVYFNIWQIRHHLPSEFKAAMVGFNLDTEKELMESGSPFAFHCVNESGVMRFMKLLGLENDRIGSYTKLVKDRNRIAHCNAVVFPSDVTALEDKVAEVLKIVDEIQMYSKPIIEAAYYTFLSGAGPQEEWPYTEAADMVREDFIHANYLSAKDVEICAAFDLGTLGEQGSESGVKSLHQALVKMHEDSVA